MNTLNGRNGSNKAKKPPETRLTTAHVKTNNVGSLTTKNVGTNKKTWAGLILLRPGTKNVGRTDTTPARD